MSTTGQEQLLTPLGKLMCAIRQERKIGRRTDKWHIYDRLTGRLLAVVCWYNLWQQYVFKSCSATEFSRDCLANLMSFLDSVNTAPETTEPAP